MKATPEKPAPCPICADPLPTNPPQVRVGDQTVQVCCEQCAREAWEQPSRLLSKI